MDKKELDEIGKAFDLDETIKAYDFGGENVYWTDYTFDWFNELPQEEQMKAENSDHAWDSDSYFEDFDNWWCSLPKEKQEEIYNKIQNSTHYYSNFRI